MHVTLQLKHLDSVMSSQCILLHALILCTITSFIHSLLCRWHILSYSCLLFYLFRLQIPEFRSSSVHVDHWPKRWLWFTWKRLHCSDSLKSKLCVIIITCSTWIGTYWMLIHDETLGRVCSIFTVTYQHFTSLCHQSFFILTLYKHVDWSIKKLA